MRFNPRSVTFLMGPTASGKTRLATELAHHYPFEIISVDSAMVYRGLDIGTAKPTAEELKTTPHRLIDICDPEDVYSVADFCRDAKREIEAIFRMGKWPLLVGGTMLYFKALYEGLAKLPTRDPAIREGLLKEAKEIGWPALHQRLQQLDPEVAKNIQPTDSQRIQRALEVILLTGKPMSILWRESSLESPLSYPVNACAIAPGDRRLLHQRIRARFMKMIAQGLVDEVRALHCRENLNLALPAMRSVGYRQIWQMLDGDLTEKEAIEKAIVATRRLAKRQLTWLRAWSGLIWLDSESPTLRSEFEVHLGLNKI